jgi:replicative DNA helicase
MGGGRSMQGPECFLLWHEEAEQAVLGAMLLADNAPLRAIQVLAAEDFYRERHRVLFRLLQGLTERGIRVDHVTLRDELVRRGELDAIGGHEYLIELVDAVTTAVNLEFHAGIVRDYAIRRHLVAEAAQATQLAGDLTRPVAASLTGFVDQLVRAALPAENKPRTTVRSELIAVLDDIERQTRLGDCVRGIGSGIEALDQLTDGWVPGRLVVIAARPKVGKTGFGLHCAREACEADIRTHYVTAEQPRRQLLRRLIAIEARLDLRTITEPALLDRHGPALSRAANQVAEWPLVIDEDARTPGAVRLGIQRHQAEHGPVGLVIADYLGKFHSGERSERHDLEIAKMTGAFARMAVDLDVPVLLLVQLNRNSVSQGQVRRPIVSDLRGSGAIEQDADQVLFLYRDEKSEQAK